MSYDNMIVLCTLKFGDHGPKVLAKYDNKCDCAKCSIYPTRLSNAARKAYNVSENVPCAKLVRTDGTWQTANDQHPSVGINKLLVCDGGIESRPCSGMRCSAKWWACCGISIAVDEDLIASS